MCMSISKTALNRTFSWKWEIANDWLGKSVTPFRYGDCVSAVILYWNNSGLLYCWNSRETGAAAMDPSEKQSFFWHFFLIWFICFVYICCKKNPTVVHVNSWLKHASQEQELQELFYWVEGADLSCCESQGRLAIRHGVERFCDPSWKDEVPL